MFVRSLWILLVGLLSACSQMGETCNSSSNCADGGTCLKGVCSAYSCVDDLQCTNGYSCQMVLSTKVCSLSCESDSDCLGEQKCTEVTPDVEGELPVEKYCM